MIIACIISFIVGVVLMMFALGIVSVCKDKEPRNKVRFYIYRYSRYRFNLTILIKDTFYTIIEDINFEEWGLNPNDFENLRLLERKEVFLNLED